MNSQGAIESRDRQEQNPQIEAGRLCATGWTNGVVFGPASGVGKQVGGFARGFHPLSGSGSLLALVFWQP